MKIDKHNLDLVSEGKGSELISQSLKQFLNTAGSKETITQNISDIVTNNLRSNTGLKTVVGNNDEIKVEDDSFKFTDNIKKNNNGLFDLVGIKNKSSNKKTNKKLAKEKFEETKKVILRQIKRLLKKVPESITEDDINNLAMLKDSLEQHARDAGFNLNKRKDLETINNQYSKVLEKSVEYQDIKNKEADLFTLNPLNLSSLAGLADHVKIMVNNLGPFSAINQLDEQQIDNYHGAFKYLESKMVRVFNSIRAGLGDQLKNDAEKLISSNHIADDPNIHIPDAQLLPSSVLLAMSVFNSAMQSINSNNATQDSSGSFYESAFELMHYVSSTRNQLATKLS